MSDEKIEFKIGDVVVLNSGGPDMSIVSFEEGTKLLCSWVSDNGNFSAVFDSRCLTKKR
jgi:uncharacterized protein YodC (DUF2158 family)